MALSLGTSGVVFAATDRPLYEPEGRVHAFCHAVPGRWHLMSVMLSAAGSLRWFRDALAPGDRVRRTSSSAAAEVAGGQRRPALPALPDRRAEPVPGPARPRRLRRADPRPRSAPPDPGGPRGRRLRPARRPRPDARGRACPRPTPDPGIRRRHREPAVAPDPGRRARDGDRDRVARPRARPTGRRSWPRSARAGSPTVDDGDRRPSSRSTPVAAPGPGRRRPTGRRTRRYRALYPALAPTFHRPADRERPRRPGLGSSRGARSLPCPSR